MIDQAVALWAKTDKPLPPSLEILAKEISSLNPLLSMRLDQLLDGD